MKDQARVQIYQNANSAIGIGDDALVSVKIDKADLARIGVGVHPQPVGGDCGIHPDEQVEGAAGVEETVAGADRFPSRQALLDRAHGRLYRIKHPVRLCTSPEV